MTITANSSVNAGTGDNIITLDGGTGEIGGGANAFIDGGDIQLLTNRYNKYSRLLSTVLLISEAK